MRAAGAKPQTIAVRMTVWSFTLPTLPGLKQGYNLCDNANGHGFPKIYRLARVAEMQRKFEDMLLGEFRIDVYNIYRTTPPKHWNAERLRKLVDLGLTGICLGYFPPGSGTCSRHESRHQRPYRGDQGLPAGGG